MAIYTLFELVPVTTELEMVPWLSVLFTLLGFIVMYSGKIGNKPLFNTEDRPFNHGDNVSWVFGMFVFYPLFTTFISYLNRPDDARIFMFKSGMVLYYLIILAASIYLILPFLFDITVWKIIEISITFVLMITYQFINWPQDTFVPGGFWPLLIFLITLISIRVFTLFLWLIPSTRDSLFIVKKSFNPSLKEIMYSRQSSGWALLALIASAYLILANILIF